jgi:hypothetical protein
MTTKNVFIHCKSCGFYLLHKAFGLCRSCYDKKRLIEIGDRKKELKEYYQNHKQEYLLKNRKSYYLGKDKARKIAKRLNLRGNECRFCKSKDNLNFHHTNYEKNEGFTLCRSCHNNLHRIENLKAKAGVGDLNE